VSQSDFVSRGQALVASGQYQEAVKVCRLGLLGRPTTVEGRIVLGQALLALKRYDEVLAEMRVAIELDHGAVAAHTLKAEALLKKGDLHAAIETLHGARAIAPADPRLLQLLGEAEHGPKATGAAHPSASFIGASDTKHYPGPAEGEPGDQSEGFTKPTSLAMPPAAPRKPPPPRRKDPTPPEAVLQVGDKSGTVEVDPALDGVQVEDDLDFDDLAAPPSRRKQSPTKANKSGVKKAQKSMPSKRTPTMEVELEDENLEVEETSGHPKLRRSSGSAVREAVKLPSGPIDVEDSVAPPPSRNKPRTDSRRAEAPQQMRISPPPTAYNRDLALQQTVPASAAQLMAARMNNNELTIPAPHGPPMPVMPPPAPLPPAPRVPALGAAMPTMAAVPPHPGMAPHPGMPGQPQYPGMMPPQPHGPMSQQMPPQPMPMMQAQMLPAQQMPPGQYGHPGASPQQLAIAQRSTLAIGAQVPVGTDPNNPNVGPYGGDPNWPVAGAHEPTMRPSDPIDPHLQMLMDGRASVPMDMQQQPSRTGMRRRSKLSIVLWIVIGVAVIGGGVFAGFQIRSVRLQKEIVAARQRATDLAKSDTWSGWTSAEASLAGIVQASATMGNRAALARAKALIAFELAEGGADAKTAVDGLGGNGGFDGLIASAYLALSQGDSKTAGTAAKAALAAAPNDASASYVAGQAALLDGDPRGAVKLARDALEKEGRPFFALGLARAEAAAYSWDDALASIERAAAGNADQAAAVIARGFTLADAGRLGAGVPITAEVRTQLDKIAAEAKKPNSNVSPAQGAFADLALARVDFARGEAAAALADVRAALGVGADDQRFAETTVETLFETGEIKLAEKAARTALDNYPTSRPARILLARTLLAQGLMRDAQAALDKLADPSPYAIAIRGQIKLAAGDVDGARADFDAAVQKQPNLEPALVGQATLALRAGDVEAARRLIEPRVTDKGASPAIAIADAAVLRRGDDAAKQKAKAMLERLAGGAAGALTPRAELELARLDREEGDFGAARKMYASAGQAGNAEARLEGAVMAIDDRDPAGGRETLDTLLKAAGDQPSAELVLETARARMLVGDHAGAEQLLETADKLPGIVKWKLSREKGRFALRRGDVAGASSFLSTALDGSGDDIETVLLFTDTAMTLGTPALADKLKKVVAERFKSSPIAQIVTGKLMIQAGKDDEAEAAYRSARDTLRAQHAAARLIAQADYGLAVVAYNKNADPIALDELNSVLNGDPSLFDAYLFKADLTKDKKAAYELAQIAVKYNPDSARAWVSLGKLAAKNNDKANLTHAINEVTRLAPGSGDLNDLLKLRR